MMKKISILAGLSTEYTNHCIRATTITNLANKGHSLDVIKNVSGHKRTESVDRYVKRITATKKKKISNDLSFCLKGENEETTEKIESQKIIAIENQPACNGSSSVKQPTVTLEKDGCLLKIFL